jgi:hypothetical protein
MTQPRTLPLTPELEAVYRARGGRRRLSPAPGPVPVQQETETQSAPQAAQEPGTYLNTPGGVFWNAEQHAALDRGVSWDDVNAMDPWRCRRCGGLLRQPLMGPKRCATCGDTPS